MAGSGLFFDSTPRPGLPEGGAKALGQHRKVLDFALPNNPRDPAHAGDVRKVPSVPFFVGRELLRAIVLPAPRQVTDPSSLVVVPEAPAEEDQLPADGALYLVGLARHAGGPEAIALAVH